MAKNSLQLRKEMSLSQFYRLSHELATDYAHSATAVARTALTEKYDITISSYYTLLEFAVSHNLVKNDVVKKIRSKILYNQNSHASTGYRSTVKYDRLEKERKNYSAYSQKDIREIAVYFATHPELSKLEVAEHFSLYRTQVLDRILYKACTELILTDTMFEVLRKRSIKTAEDQHKTINFFETLFQRRVEKKQEIKKGSSL